MCRKCMMNSCVTNNKKQDIKNCHKLQVKKTTELQSDASKIKDQSIKIKKKLRVLLWEVAYARGKQKAEILVFVSHFLPKCARLLSYEV